MKLKILVVALLVICGCVYLSLPKAKRMVKEHKAANIEKQMYECGEYSNKATCEENSDKCYWDENAVSFVGKGFCSAIAEKELMERVEQQEQQETKTTQEQEQAQAQ